MFITALPKKFKSCCSFASLSSISLATWNNPAEGLLHDPIWISPLPKIISGVPLIIPAAHPPNVSKKYFLVGTLKPKSSTLLLLVFSFHQILKWFLFFLEYSSLPLLIVYLLWLRIFHCSFLISLSLTCANEIILQLSYGLLWFLSWPFRKGCRKSDIFPWSRENRIAINVRLSIKLSQEP